MQLKVLGVIPARFASSRFPAKAIAIIAGKPMIQHVYERAMEAKSIHKLLIATDDKRIYQAAASFGADVRMTRSDHSSGTDRVAEVAASEEHEIIVNIQGDEPLIDPAAIDLAVDALCDAAMSTLKKRIEEPSEIANHNVVKVVAGLDNNAIYFSRSPIPYNRGGEVDYFKHIGLYVYQREFLLGYSKMPVGPLEKAERLEQLRALENGHKIRVVETKYESLGVDTPEDLERVKGMFGGGA